MIINTIDKAIEEKGITAYRVAKDLGINKVVFSRLKHKKNTLPNPTNLGKLCAYLDCQPGDLIHYVPDNQDQINN